MALIEIEDLEVTFAVKGHMVRAVRGVSMAVEARSALGIVGESGSGKSTVLRAICGLAPVTGGAIRIGGETLGRRRDRAFARRVQMVFQDPYASLHPRHTIDRTLGEPLTVHGLASGDERGRRIVRALEDVGLDPAFRFRYPHQLSGGQRQRVAVARALMLEPEILLLDEPTSALDASVQSEVLNLLSALRAARALTYVMVSHDLAVIDHMTEATVVMREGGVVERLERADLAAGRMAQAYTRELFAASIMHVPD
ncbi:MAG: ABC transporter ATP-binding protein [Pseudomonadota bacterium]